MRNKIYLFCSQWFWKAAQIICTTIKKFFFKPHFVTKCHPGRFSVITSSTAQGGGGSFKNRKPIGEVGCCESGMAERSHWWSERWLISLTISLSFSDYLPTYLSSIYLSSYLSLSTLFLCHLITYLPIYLSNYLSIYLSLSLFHLSICLAVYLSIYISIYLSVCLSICLPVYLWCSVIHCIVV